MKPKGHLMWLGFRFERMLITGLGQQTLVLALYSAIYHNFRIFFLCKNLKNVLLHLISQPFHTQLYVNIDLLYSIIRSTYKYLIKEIKENIIYLLIKVFKIDCKPYTSVRLVNILVKGKSDSESISRGQLFLQPI